jgi:signal transduction histidine kinase
MNQLPYLLLHADRHKILIVLRNLLSNAIKFTSKSDRKDIHIRVSITNKIYNGMSSNRNNNNNGTQSILPCVDLLKIEIIDTGPGISAVIYNNIIYKYNFL